jgi:hypothetical protein
MALGACQVKMFAVIDLRFRIEHTPDVRNRDRAFSYSQLSSILVASVGKMFCRFG